MSWLAINVVDCASVEGHLFLVQRTQTVGLGSETKKRKNSIRTLTQTRAESAGQPQTAQPLYCSSCRVHLLKAGGHSQVGGGQRKTALWVKWWLTLAFQVTQSSKEKTVKDPDCFYFCATDRLSKKLQTFKTERAVCWPSVGIQSLTVLQEPPAQAMATLPDPQSGVNVYSAEV